MVRIFPRTLVGWALFSIAGLMGLSAWIAQAFVLAWLFDLGLLRCMAIVAVVHFVDDITRPVLDSIRDAALSDGGER